MIFEISGNDLIKLQNFQLKHEDCLYKHPNISCAQYEYTFVPDGFGVFKVVKCICGESIILTDDYDLGCDTPFQEIKKEPKDYNKDLIARLFDIEKRPGMFFGKNPSWYIFSWFVKGMMDSSRMQAKYYDSVDLSLTNDITDILLGVNNEIENGNITEDNAVITFYKKLHVSYGGKL